jgi:ppGpp synthetase/RelA/SpoT-type nucleotidyltranferase
VVRSVSVQESLTEAVPRPGNNPLADAYLKAAIKEIEQTAVAVSVVGTRTWKLKQMAGLVEPVADALVGERSEVAKVRSRLKRLAHNAQVSVTDARQASAALEELAKGLRDARRMLEKGLGGAEPVFGVADFQVLNSWGYSDSEVRDVKRVLERVYKHMQDIGLLTVSGGLAELNPGGVKGAVFVQYDPDSDMLVFDLGKARSVADDTEKVLQALAERLWKQEFRSGDRETWGEGKNGMVSFSGAFAGLLSGRRVDKEDAARLQVTAGKMAARWPEKKTVQASRELTCLDSLLQEVVHPLGHISQRKDGPWLKTSEKPPDWERVKGSMAAVREEDPETKKLREIADIKEAVKNIDEFVKAGRLAKGVSVGQHIKIAKAVRKAHQKRFDGFLDDLKKLTSKVVEGRVKDFHSILGKITRTDDQGRARFKTANDFGDSTGARIVANSTKEVYDIVEKIKANSEKFGMKVIEEDDKIQRPQGEAKYRSYHLGIRDRDGNVKELQIRTVRQHMASNWSHDIYKPFNREQREAIRREKPQIVEYAAKVSDHFSNLDAGQKSTVPPCPKVVSRYFGCLT